MPVIGTAGHVDHGKSSLVQALTGIDPDRLAEEKRRGLTIDLGFAWLSLPSGREVGIVDVPGHERFIRNMLAGVGAINLALFVVAANEGWMPQSQEHLDILDLLGVSVGVVALTKADAADQSTLESAAGQARDRLAGTSLAGAPVVAVSARTGRGLDELKSLLDAAVDAVAEPPGGERPRLWIDRVFSMKGSGTVVTGTLTGGALSEDDEVEILPSGVRSRVRGIQSHRRKLERIEPGNRTAMNLVGVEPDQIRRGDVASHPGNWRPSRRLLVEIRFLPHLGHDPSERGAFKFHIGSAEVDAELRFLGPVPRLGEAGLASMLLSSEVVADWRDRFVLRDAGRRETLGGGFVLEPHAPAERPAGLLARAEARTRVGDRAGYLGAVLEEERFMPFSEIRLRTGVAPEDAPGAVAVEGGAFGPGAFDASGKALLAALSGHQQSHPLDAGMPRPAALASTGLPPRVFEGLVAELVRRGLLVADADVLRTPDFRPAVSDPERDALLAELSAAGASPPTVGDLARRFDPSLIKALVRARDLVQVSAELVYPAAFVEEIKIRIRSRVAGSGPFSVAEFRDLLGTTRKYAVPVLEYLDSAGFTRRQGDLRVLGPKAG